MPMIKVNTAGVSGLCTNVRGVKSKNSECYSNLNRIKNNLDWQVKAKSNISGRISALQRRVSNQSDKLDAYIRVLETASGNFADKDRRIKNDVKGIIYNLKSINMLTGIRSKVKTLLKFHIESSLFAKINELFNSVSSNDSVMISNFISGSENAIDGISTILDKASIDEKLANELSFASGIVGYVGSVWDTVGGKHTNLYDAMASWFSLIKSSANTEKALYDYLLTTLNANEAMSLYNSKGGFVSNISNVGNVVGLIATGMESGKVFFSPDSSVPDKVVAAIDTIKAGGQTGAGFYISGKYGELIIDKTKNKLVASDLNGLKRFKGGVRLFTSILDSISSGVKKYEETTIDGEFDLGDAGAVGITAGVNGLVSIVPGGRIAEAVVESITGKNADDLADGICNEINQFGPLSKEWVDEHEVIKNYISDESNSKFMRNVAGCGAVVCTMFEHYNPEVIGWAERLFGAS